jgi:hypothetical protein
VKVLVPDGNGEATATSADVAAGIMYAADHGATVINLSLGSITSSVFGPSFADAVEYAFGKGAISVIAAGNNLLLPSGGGNLDAIVVGALDKFGAKASYANNIGDAKWALMAPGGEPTDSTSSCQAKPDGILSTFFQDQYACLAGTSMAAPHVAGAVAVLRSMGYAPEDAVNRLLATATPMAPSFAFGSGKLDLAAATEGGPNLSTTSSNPPSSSDAGPTGTTSDTTPSTSTDSATDKPPNGDAVGVSPPAVALPSNGKGAKAGRPVTARSGGGNNDLPAGPVAVAVLLASSVGAGSGWLLIRGASWARRTPLG